MIKWTRLLFLLLVISCSSPKTNDALVGSWALYQVLSDPATEDGSEQKMNDQIKEGAISSTVVFKEDASYEITMNEADSVIQSGKGTYRLSENGRILTSIRSDGQKTDAEIRSLEGDTLKIRFTPDQTSVLVRKKS